MDKAYTQSTLGNCGLYKEESKMHCTRKKRKKFVLKSNIFLYLFIYLLLKHVNAVLFYDMSCLKLLPSDK